MNPQPFIQRHFYRCADCLSVAATLAKLPEKRDGYWGIMVVDAICDACTGKIEYMGSTTRQTLRHITGVEAACDGKCINAIGPSCDCQCHGENHGSGKVVDVYTDSAIPRVKMASDAVEKAATYRALAEQFKAAWNAQYAAITERKRYEYLGAEFSRYMDGQYIWKRYAKARQNRTHASRNKNLLALIAELTKGSKQAA